MNKKKMKIDSVMIRTKPTNLVEMKRHVVDFDDDVAWQSGGAKPAKERERERERCFRTKIFHGNG